MRDLDILETLCSDTQRRLKRLLGMPDGRPVQTLQEAIDAGIFSSWRFPLHVGFFNALDIKYLSYVKKTDTNEKEQEYFYTQGWRFAFAPGYTIYDTAEAYTQPWGKTLTVMHYCIGITDAVPAGGGEDETSKGAVAFDVYTPTPDRSAVQKIASHTVTQPEFVRLCITGELPNGHL